MAEGETGLLATAATTRGLLPVYDWLVEMDGAVAKVTEPDCLPEVRVQIRHRAKLALNFVTANTPPEGLSAPYHRALGILANHVLHKTGADELEMLMAARVQARPTESPWHLTDWDRTMIVGNTRVAVAKVLYPGDPTEQRMNRAVLLHAGEMYEALAGDPDAPRQIGPLSWLREMLKACESVAAVEALAGDDPPSWYDMVQEVRELVEKLDRIVEKVRDAGEVVT